MCRDLKKSTHESFLGPLCTMCAHLAALGASLSRPLLRRHRRRHPLSSDNTSPKRAPRDVHQKDSGSAPSKRDGGEDCSQSRGVDAGTVPQHLSPSSTRVRPPLFSEAELHRPLAELARHGKCEQCVGATRRKSESSSKGAKRKR